MDVLICLMCICMLIFVKYTSIKLEKKEISPYVLELPKCFAAAQPNLCCL